VRRRDTASLTAAAALALSFAPTLMRRGKRAQLAISTGSVLLGGLAGAATEGVVLRLARELEGGEPAARGILIGAGAVATLAELPRDPHPAVALAGQVARVSGICALLGSIAPEREAVPLDDPRKLGALQRLVGGDNPNLLAVGADQAHLRHADALVDARLVPLWGTPVEAAGDRH